MYECMCNKIKFLVMTNLIFICILVELIRLQSNVNKRLVKIVLWGKVLKTAGTFIYGFNIFYVLFSRREMKRNCIILSIHQEC